MARRRTRPLRAPRLPLGRRRSTVALLIVLALVALGYLELPSGKTPGGSSAGHTPAPGSKLKAEVVRVVDGDTAVVEFGGREERLRYIGIDTPESVQPGRPVECFGPEASRRNTDLVAGRRVQLEIGAEPRDRYGRLLAYVRIGERMVNEELLRGGYATVLTIPPNDRYADRFDRAEAAAQRSGQGLWTRCKR